MALSMCKKLLDSVPQVFDIEFMYFFLIMLSFYLFIANIFLDPFCLVDKMSHMVGSYPPKVTIQSYTTPYEEAPSGMLARGTYSVKSLFTDDDKNEHLKWDWTFEIKKDW